MSAARCLPFELPRCFACLRGELLRFQRQRLLQQCIGRAVRRRAKLASRYTSGSAGTSPPTPPPPRPAPPDDPEELREQIEQTRERLGETVQALAAGGREGKGAG